MSALFLVAVATDEHNCNSFYGEFKYSVFIYFHNLITLLDLPFLNPAIRHLNSHSQARDEFSLIEHNDFLLQTLEMVFFGSKKEINQE